MSFRHHDHHDDHHHHHHDHHDHHHERPYIEECPPHHHAHPYQPPAFVEEDYGCCDQSFGNYTPGYDQHRVHSNFYEGSPAGGRLHQNSSYYQSNERLGGLGGLAAGAFSLYEANKAKHDPRNAIKHKYEAEAAALGPMGSGGYAYYEQREKDKLYDGPRW